MTSESVIKMPSSTCGTKYISPSSSPTFENAYVIWYFAKEDASSSGKHVYAGTTLNTTAQSCVGTSVYKAGYGISTTPVVDGSNVFSASTKYTYTHSISLKKNGSSHRSTSQNVVYYDTNYYSGADASLTASAINGYTFEGWSAYGSGNSCTIPKETPGDISVTGNYRPNTYTISFNTNGGSGSVNSISADYDQTYSCPLYSGTKSGWTFAGWSTSSSATTPTYQTGSDLKNLTTTDGATVTLYAVWQQSITVSYNSHGGSDNPSSSSSAIGATSHTVTLPSAGTKTGYTFGGWSLTDGGTSVGGVGSKYTTESSVTLHALWTAISYTVAYNNNNSSATGSTASSSHTYDVEKKLTKNGFALSNYTFSGWSTSASGEVAYSDEESVKNLSSTNNATVNLYAKWSPVKYTITVNAGNGGTASGGGSYDYGSTHNITATPNTHYTFSKWNDDDTSNPRTITVSGNATYTASFTANTYTVSFDSHGGTSCSAQSKQYPVSITLPSPTRTGYSFNGWYTAESGGTKVGNGGASYQPLSTTTIHAQWTANKYYIDVYNGVSTSPISSTQVSYDSVFTASAPTRSHYIFKGWQVTANLNSTTGKWGTTNAPSTTISSANTVCYNGTSGSVYFKNLNTSATASNVRVSITALWERKSYSVTIGQTADRWDARVICTGGSFTHWNGTSNVSVDSNIDTTIKAGKHSGTFTFYAGMEYKVRSTYNVSSETGNFYVLKSWGGYAVSRVNSGSSAAVFEMSHTMGDSENNATQTWPHAFKSVTASVSSPFDDINPSVTLSFDDSDIAGNKIKAVAGTNAGIGFTQWTNVSGTQLETASSVSTTKFQVTESDVSLTASYHKDSISVSASLDNLSSAACGSSQPTIVISPTTIMYRDTATVSIAGIPATLTFAGWYANGTKVSELASYSFTATSAISLVAKLKAVVTLSKVIEGNASGNIVLNGTTYQGQSCSQSVVIGDSISIGVTLNNANSYFICWFNSTDSERTPLDYAQNQSGIVITNTTGISALLMDQVQIHYVAFYNRNVSTNPQTIVPSLGQLTPSGTSFEIISKSTYETATSSTAMGDGVFVKFNSTQRMQLSIVKTGGLEYLRCKRFKLGASTEGTAYSTEQTVVSTINQNFVFIAEWGSPTKYDIVASLCSSGDLEKGSVDLGGYVSDKSYGGTSTSGKSEEGMSVAVWAKANNGYDFSGWYATSECTGDPVSTDAYYEFNMPSSAKTLYAKFVTASVSLYKWEGGSNNLQLKWVSKSYALSKPSNLNSVRVDSTGYPIARTKIESFSSPDYTATSTVDLTGNAALTNQTMRRLPSRRPERFFRVTVESTNEIDAIILGTSGEGLAT